MGTRDGWEYWTRVYDDPMLRSKIDAHNQDGPTVSEVLCGERLRRTQLLFTNVPRVRNYKDVKQLIESHLPEATLLDIKTYLHRWVVDFYRMEDAQSAQRQLDGLKWRGRFLIVRADNSLDDKVDESVHSTSFIDSQHPQDDSLSPSISQPNHCSPFTDFDKALMELLETTGPLTLDDRRLWNLSERLDKGQGTFASWPLGVLRTCVHCRVVGGYVCRVEDEQTVWQWCIRDQCAAVSRESWEPMAPSEIRDTRQLAVYTHALLSRFGPLSTSTGPLPLLAQVLSADVCQMDSLGTLVAEGAEVVMVGQTLYLTTEQTHRQTLAEAVTRPSI